MAISCTECLAVIVSNRVAKLPGSNSQHRTGGLHQRKDAIKLFWSRVSSSAYILGGAFYLMGSWPVPTAVAACPRLFSLGWPFSLDSLASPPPHRVNPSFCRQLPVIVGPAIRPKRWSQQRLEAGNSHDDVALLRSVNVRRYCRGKQRRCC